MQYRLWLAAFFSCNSQADEGEEESPASKVRILVRNSRLIFGVADPTPETGEQLSFGQCFLRLTIDGIPRTVVCARVVVVRTAFDLLRVPTWKTYC